MDDIFTDTYTEDVIEGTTGETVLETAEQSPAETTLPSGAQGGSGLFTDTEAPAYAEPAQTVAETAGAPAETVTETATEPPAETTTGDTQPEALESTVLEEATPTVTPTPIEELSEMAGQLETLSESVAAMQDTQNAMYKQQTEYFRYSFLIIFMIFAAVVLYMFFSKIQV